MEANHGQLWRRYKDFFARYTLDLLTTLANADDPMTISEFMRLMKVKNRVAILKSANYLEDQGLIESDLGESGYRRKLKITLKGLDVARIFEWVLNYLDSPAR